MAYLGDIREDNPEKEIGQIWGNVNAASKRYKWNGMLLDISNIDPQDTRLYVYTYNYVNADIKNNPVEISKLSVDNTLTITASEPVASYLQVIIKYQYTDENGNVQTQTTINNINRGSKTTTTEPLYSNGSDFKVLNVIFSPETDEKYSYVLEENIEIDYSMLYYGVIRSKDLGIISPEMITGSTYHFEIINDMTPGVHSLYFELIMDSIEGLNDAEDEDIENLKAELSNAMVIVYDNDFENIIITDALGMIDNTWEKLGTTLKMGDNEYNVLIHRDAGDQVDLRDASAPKDNPVIFTYGAELR